jgi:diguanylate cyclase (GGDEF)-like protein
MSHSRTSRGWIWPAVAGCAALGFALFGLSGFAVGVAARHASSARAERVRNLEALARLTAREEARVGSAPFNGATAKRMSNVLSGLERATPNNGRLDSLVEPTMTAVSLARQGQSRRARATFGRVSSAATSAALAEAATGMRKHKGIVLRLQEEAAAIAAVLGSLFGLLAFIAWPRRRNQTHDRTVEALTEQARTDNLTGLGNQRAFQEAMSAAIAERTATDVPFVVLAIDLDGLKQINDTLGHIAGDARIKEIADCIRRVVGTRGAVHRTGGDEFMVILPGQRNIHGLAIARRIDAETRARVGNRAVSIGLTESLAAEGRHLIVGQADLALYEAKRTRLNAVVFNPGLAKPIDSIGRRRTGPSQEQRALAAALARAVDAKDVGTQSHGETVAQLCVAIGERVGLAGDDLERLRLAGLLHDVGKIGIADAILQKPRPLDNDERTAMTDHVQIGHAILLAAELPVEAYWVLHHHERYDGTGYPSCQRGTEIPLASRIIAVADAYEAMTGDRPYRTGITPELALEELRKNVGTQFDGRCLDALVQAINESALLDLPVRTKPAPRLSLVSSLPRPRRGAPAALAAEETMPSQGIAKLER